MPITFLSFVSASEQYLIKLLRENNKQINDRVINEFFTHIMGGFYTHPTQYQHNTIQNYAEQLIKNGIV